MSSGSWGTVWEISARRANTRMGESHLTEHAQEVLHGFVVQEAQDAIQAAMGAVAKKFFR